jgi:hypothetical protein
MADTLFASMSASKNSFPDNSPKWMISLVAALTVPVNSSPDINRTVIRFPLLRFNLLQQGISLTYR